MEAYGQRIPIWFWESVSTGNVVWRRCVLNLPDVAMVHSVHVTYSTSGTSTQMWVDRALGDMLPTSEAEFDALERGWRCGQVVNEQEDGIGALYNGVGPVDCRQIIEPQGRALILELGNNGSSTQVIGGVIVLSGVPSL